MMKWLLSAAQSAAAFVVPGVGPALKWGPWIGVAVLFGLLLIERARLTASEAQTTTQAELVQQTRSECHAEDAQATADVNAATTAHVQRAQLAANSAEVQLFAQYQATQAAQDLAAQQLGAALATIATQAAQPGQDGPISPPVLAGWFR